MDTLWFLQREFEWQRFRATFPKPFSEMIQMAKDIQKELGETGPLPDEDNRANFERQFIQDWFDTPQGENEAYKTFLHYRFLSFSDILRHNKNLWDFIMADVRGNAENGVDIGYIFGVKPLIGRNLPKLRSKADFTKVQR